jgi:hypothetical protein
VIVIIFPNNYNLQLYYLILYDPISRLFLESYSYPVYMQYDILWQANAGRPQKYWSIYRMHITVQIWVPNQFWSENTTVQIYLKIILFSIWVSNSEERKPNLRKSYLRMLVRITESLYSGGGTPTSGSTSAYAGSGSTSSFASGSESTKSPIINLNWAFVSFYVF